VSNAFRTAARSILRRLPRAFGSLLRISSIRRILPEEPATLEPSGHDHSESRMEDHRQRPHRLAL
jgi:hypothetical protein